MLILSEAELIARIKDGDRSCLADLMDRHGSDLMRFLVSILGNRSAAEDAFQDTWVRVMEKIGSFRSGQPLAPWLFRIARNRAYDLRRRGRRWWAPWRREESCRDALPQPVDPRDFAGELQRRELLAKLFASLASSHREILWLRFFGECSLEEIAQVLQLPLGTVKSRLNRALGCLAENYRQLEVQP